MKSGAIGEGVTTLRTARLTKPIGPGYSMHVGGSPDDPGDCSWVRGALIPCWSRLTIVNTINPVVSQPAGTTRMGYPGRPTR
jgi:hypothetical protein